MNAKEFFEKVAAMRYHQKRYFQTKSKDALEMSKKIERQIDDEIDRVNRVLTGQKSLWDK